MFRIGSHLSTTKGYLAMGREALRIGANTFQFFTRNPRGGAAKALDPDDVAAYRAFAAENDIQDILAHASYTLNPASPEKKQQDFVRQTIADDLDRLTHFPGAMYNIHPGSGGKQDKETAIKMVAENLNATLRPSHKTMFLLETMAGKGSEVGGSFEELRAVIDLLKVPDNVGVCLDTCHVFDGGYDIVNALDDVLARFDKIVGLKRLRAVHLNDSKNSMGSHKDRHAKLGEGDIGLEAFARIVNHPDLRDLPFYLETPNDNDGYAAEIAILKKLRREEKTPAQTPEKAAPKKPAAKKKG